MRLIYSHEVALATFNPPKEPLLKGDALVAYEEALQLIEPSNEAALRKLASSALGTTKMIPVGLLVWNPTLMRVEVVSLQRAVDLPAMLGRGPDIGDELFEMYLKAVGKLGG